MSVLFLGSWWTKVKARRLLALLRFAIVRLHHSFTLLLIWLIRTFLSRNPCRHLYKYANINSLISCFIIYSHDNAEHTEKKLQLELKNSKTLSPSQNPWLLFSPRTQQRNCERRQNNTARSSVIIPRRDATELHRGDYDVAIIAPDTPWEPV